MKRLVLRNIRLYFRDRVSVLFSLMSLFVTIGLYAFFLGDSIMKGSLDQLEQGKNILNLWLLAGLVSIVSITTPLAAFHTMVSDRSDGIMKDFYVSCMKRYKLVLSYILAACFIGCVMSIITLVIGNLYIWISGGEIVDLLTLCKILGVIIMAVGVGSAMMFFLASFLHTSSSFSNASVIVGTLNGFLMGIYIPVGVLPSFAQLLVKGFPLSYGTMIFRSLLVDQPLAEAMKGAPPELIEDVRMQLGITLQIGNINMSIPSCIIVLMVTTIVFFLLSTLVFKIKKN